MIKRKSSGSCSITYSVTRYRGPEGQLATEDDAPEDWPEEEVELEVRGWAVDDRETKFRDCEYELTPEMKLDEWEREQLAIEVWEACLQPNEDYCE